MGTERKITEYLLFDQQNVLQQVWQPESTNTALFWRKLEPKEKSRNIFYLISKMSCNKSGSRRVLIQHNTALFWKAIETKEKSRNIFYLISKMSCNKSGSRRVPIQHYLEKIWTERKIMEYLLFDQQNVLQQIWQPESTNTAQYRLFWKK